jgi:hypothetical protein
MGLCSAATVAPAPATLDEIEASYGEYALNEMMERYGRWIDITPPQHVAVVAHVNGRAYEVHAVPANEIGADFVVDTDEGLIILPINAPMFSLVQALCEVAQHEPGPSLAARPVLNRPVQLDPAAWPQPAA